MKEMNWEEYWRDVSRDRIGIVGLLIAAICLVVGLLMGRK